MENYNGNNLGQSNHADPGNDNHGNEGRKNSNQGRPAGEYNYGDGKYYINMQSPEKKGGMPDWVKVIIIILLIVLLIVGMCVACSSGIKNAFSGLDDSLAGLENTGTDVTTADFTSDYIGVLHIETTISEDGTDPAYNHEYLLKSIDDMIADDNNKGIILYLNTPGGSVYASDELYFKIREYQEKTGRPVYSSMQAMAASGGYYISAPCDKIYANRNCWTGSIGVTIGTLYDVSELLDKLGVSTMTITSGANKAMGSNVEPPTAEQVEIFQSLVDEAYDQFVGIVAEGRGISESKVRKLADGRIYSALQAKENGLIDEVGTFEDCVEAMKKDYGLSDECTAEDFTSADNYDLSSLLGIITKLSGSDASSDLNEIEELMDMNGMFEISYEANIRK